MPDLLAADPVRKRRSGHVVHNDVLVGIDGVGAEVAKIGLVRGRARGLRAWRFARAT